MTNPIRLAREVEARHERLSAHDEVLREIETAEPIDPDLHGIELTSAEVAAMTVDAPRRYHRRTHAEVRAEGYRDGWKDRDKTATQQSLAWLRRERELAFRAKVAFACGAVGGMVLLAAVQILL